MVWIADYLTFPKLEIFSAVNIEFELYLLQMYTEGLRGEQNNNYKLKSSRSQETKKLKWQRKKNHFAKNFKNQKISDCNTFYWD